MFKSLVIAGSIALGAFALTADDASAKTRIGIYFGVPFYDYQVGPGWRYDRAYGWYDYGRYGDFRRYYPANRMSCREARRLVDRSGYDRVRTVECGGRTYTFRAINKRGKLVRVYVNARTGAIWRG